MAGALPTTRPNTSYAYDSTLILKPNEGSITASGSLQSTGGTANPIIDLGVGFVEGNIRVNVSAVLATAGNGAEIYVTGTVSDSTFGTDTNIVELASYPLLGDVAARKTDANCADDSTGEFVIPFRNEKKGQLYRYIRMYTVIVSSGTISYSAVLTLHDGK